MDSKHFASGAPVWAKAPANASEAFLPATVKSSAEDGKTCVVVDEAGTERTIQTAELSPANPSGMVAPDNAYLIHISEATILANMRNRFAQNAIYTYTGSILLAVNPFQRLSIYGEDKMPVYKGKKLGAGAEPHVYAMAEVAYATFLKTGGSQSLVVSGESGAGKTETNKQLMNYLAWRSHHGDGETAGETAPPEEHDYNAPQNQLSTRAKKPDLASTILQADPVLEAFGNAKTSRNNNSSRFGKFTKVGLSVDGQVMGAITKHYLLEKSRVPFQAAGERNYHVFYQLVAGHDDREALGLVGGPTAFGYLRMSGVTEVAGVDDVALFRELCGAMGAIGMAAKEQAAVFSLLAGLLHLSNVTFVGEETSAPAPDAAPALAKLSALLGLPQLSECLVKRSMVTPSGITILNNSTEQASLARDALAKALYAQLFDFLLARVNESIRGSATEEGLFIGLLDVYGFEFFEINSFEQLCINFANEKLQQFFLSFLFKAEEALYTDEELQWTRIEFSDNQGAIDMVEKSPTGVLRLLDETCKKPGATDDHFCEAVATTHKTSRFYLEPRAAGFRQYRETQAFVVRHFAGDVCYLAKGFVEKNNDTLHADFVAQLKQSSHTIIAALNAEEGGEKGSKKGGKKSGFNSVSRKYISSMGQLMTALNSTHAHFLRCLKPNKELKPSVFTPSLVLQQLRCSGTVDAVQLMAGGYPTRIPYEAIHGRYAQHMPAFVQVLPPPLFCESLALGLSIPADAFALGKTMIFFRAGKGAALEELGDKSTEEVITMLTSNEAFMEKVRDYQRRREALMKCQAIFRSRRQQLWLRKAVAMRRMVVYQEAKQRARQRGLERAGAGLGTQGLLGHVRKAILTRQAAEAAREADKARREYEAALARDEARLAARLAKDENAAGQDKADAAGEVAIGTVVGAPVQAVTGTSVADGVRQAGAPPPQLNEIVRRVSMNRGKLGEQVEVARRLSRANSTTGMHLSRASAQLAEAEKAERISKQLLTEAEAAQQRQQMQQQKRMQQAAKLQEAKSRNKPVEHRVRLERTAHRDFGIGRAPC